jgi:flagellar basal body-associated protein FliL
MEGLFKEKNMFKKSIKKKILKFTILISLVLIVTGGLSGIVFAASGTANSSQSQSSDKAELQMFDPFTLNIILTTGDDSGGSISRPSIRITTRPLMRSYFRPPLVF